MAGHSKRHNIKHRKAAQDSKRSKIYSRIAKQLEITAKLWADPTMNPSLATVLSTAKSAWLPKDVIEKAIRKWSGQLGWEELQELYYEWYGPEGIAMYIKCITSNTNRSAAGVRSILTKYSGNMWEVGSVAWQFEQKWVIYITGKLKIEKVKWNNVETVEELDNDLLEEDIMETDVEDYDLSEDGARIVTEFEDFINVSKFFQEKSYKIESAEIEFIAKNTVNLSKEWEEKLDRLIDALEDNEDVDSVFHNAE